MPDDMEPPHLQPLSYASPATDPPLPGAGRRATNVALTFLAALVLLAIISSLFPARSGSKPRANRVKCASNLRQIGQGLLIYANDHKGRLPPTLDLLILHADLHPHVFICPQTDNTPASGATTQQIVQSFRANPQHCCYTYLPPKSLADSDVVADQIIAYESLSNHRNEGINVLCGDGSVEWLSPDETKRLLVDIASGKQPIMLPTSRPSTLPGQ